MSEIDPANVPREFLAERGAPTYVLLHGLTATPRQFAHLGERLHAAGANAIVPLLPRHGHRNRMTTALRGLRARELVDAVDTALARARDLGSPVTVAGFSMGGLLACWTAQYRHVDRVIAISPFLGPAFVPAFAQVATHAMLSATPNLFLWWNPLARERHGEGDGYPRYATAAVRELLAVARLTMVGARRAPPDTARIAMVVNPLDTTCHPGLMRRLVGAWRASGARIDVHNVNVGLRHDWITPTKRNLAEAPHDVLVRILLDEAYTPERSVS